MKVLVTGAAGFIGSHLCDKLLEEGHLVTGVDNYDSFCVGEVKAGNIGSCLAKEGFGFVEMDLRDSASTRAPLAEGWDRVVHLAGLGGVHPSIEEPHGYLENNYIATLNVLEAMRESGTDRLVFASASSVYGNNTRIPFREDDPTDRPVSPYAATEEGRRSVVPHLPPPFQRRCLRPALLHRVRAEAAAGHGNPQARQGDNEPQTDREVRRHPPNAIMSTWATS